MASTRMKLLSIYLRYRRKPKLATSVDALKHLTAPKGDPAPPHRFHTRFRVSRRTVDDFDCYSLEPGTTHPTQAVVYVHGGSYVNEILTPHWSFIGELVDAGYRVEVPIYGLAPTHDHRAGAKFLTAVYRDLLGEFDSARIAVMGDSAGGGLALAVTQSLPESDLPQPSRLVLLSPWLDVALSNPDIAAMEHKDPWLNRAPLADFARAWANGTALDSAELSPINGPLRHLPPIEVFVGTHDIVYPDVVRLHDLAAKAGTHITVHAVEGGIHVYVLAPVPEGRLARRRIVESLSDSGPSRLRQ